MESNIIIIGTSLDFSKYFFKSSSDNDFSFTPWSFKLEEKDYGCVHSICLDFISYNIFYGGYEAEIEQLDYICTLNDNTKNTKTDIFIYSSDEFINKISCDYLRYDEKTLDYDFNLFNSWIISYIYNKYSKDIAIRYYF